MAQSDKNSESNIDFYKPPESDLSPAQIVDASDSIKQDRRQHLFQEYFARSLGWLMALTGLVACGLLAFFIVMIYQDGSEENQAYKGLIAAVILFFCSIPATIFGVGLGLACLSNAARKFLIFALYAILVLSVICVFASFLNSYWPILLIICASIVFVLYHIIHFMRKPEFVRVFFPQYRQIMAQTPDCQDSSSCLKALFYAFLVLFVLILSIMNCFFTICLGRF